MNALVPLPRVGVPVTLTGYERMREAVAVVATADEAKEWIDKAAAAAFYARQIKDREVETWLTEIKRRAEYRLGEILLTIPPAKGGRPTLRSGAASSIRSTVLAAGLDPATASRLMQIAGPRDQDLQAIGRAAAESYYARARDTKQPVTREALRVHIDAAIDAAIGPEEIVRRAKALSQARQAEKARKRHRREADLAERTRAAAAELGTRLYGVIYADFPWRQEVWSRDSGLDRAADNHYPTMTDDEIEAFDLPAGPSCVLFMWTTNPKLKVAMTIMERWGFDYRSNWCWQKPHIGTGYWGREKHELLLIGVRGDVPGPAAGDQPPSSQFATRGRHSEKPDVFAQAIAKIFPVAPKVELFARAPRPGWDVWGNESDGGQP